MTTHREVRDMMFAKSIEYILVCPHESLIKEYIERFVKRGNDEKFIKFICDNWFSFIEDLKYNQCKHKIQLLSGQYLSDVVLW